YRDGELLASGILSNHELLGAIGDGCFSCCAHLAIEMVASYGMPVGATVFETCLWIGRFIQSWDDDITYTKIYRKSDVCMTLCHTTRAKDSNIRQAIIDRYPATGGGKCPQIGIKSKPGPLYGVSKDIWSALAVAITYAETKRDI
ncbi:hypothetical protein LCGC14_2742030, partial [marine sediment metagenome]